MEITSKRLAILSILVVLTQRSSGGGPEKEIDWKRCNTPLDENGLKNGHAEAICFVAKRCMRSNWLDPKLLQMDKADDMESENTCDTGIQIIPHGNSKWLVYMQAKGAQLDLNEGVRLEGGRTESPSFGCKRAANEIQPIKSEGLNWDKYPKAAPELVANDRIFCAFFISGTTDTLETLFNVNDNTRFTFKTDMKKPYDMNIKYSPLRDKVKEVKRCDPSNAEFDTSLSEDFITHKLEFGPTKNVCPDELGKLFVRYPADKEFVETSDVECKLDGGKFKYVYTPKGGSVQAIPEGAAFHAQCALKACTLCPELDATGMPTDTAVPSEYGVADVTTGKCAEAKCGSDTDAWVNNWEYADESGQLVTKMAPLACKKKGANEAAWFLKDTAIELKTAWCSKTVQCSQKQPLKYKCPASMKCTAANDTTPDFGCGDFLRTKVNGKDETIPNLNCNNQTGTWHYGDGKELQDDSVEVYCLISDTSGKVAPSTGLTPISSAIIGGLCLVVVLIVVGVVWFIIRRRRKFTPSEREERRRPRKSFWRKIFPERLAVDDLSTLKDWSEELFCKILDQWLKYSVYERKKFAERIGFELGMTTNATCFLRIMTHAFKVEPDYRVWQSLVPTFKLLHAQTTDKENNQDVDKRLRKWCISLCKPILERVGWEGCNNEWRDTAYQRYLIFNLLYYCEDKDFVEKLLEFFDKGKFHGLHSINRQVAWAAAVREKDQFEVAKRVADDAVCDKNAMREIAARKAKAAGGKQQNSSGGLFSKSKTTSDAPASDKSGKKAKSKAGSAKEKKGSKEAPGSKGGSKETKSSASKENSKSGRSNKSGKSGKDKKGSKETPSGKAKKAKDKGDSKEESKSSKRDKKGGSKEARKGGGSKEKRERGGADSKEESGKEKKTQTQSEKDRKKDKKDKSDKSGKSGKDKKGSKEGGKDKSGRSGKSSKEKKDKSDKSNKSKKDKKKGDKSGKDAKTCPSSEKGTKSGKSGKDKKDKSNKSSKTTSGKEAKTAKDKTMETSGKGSTKSAKARKKPAALGYKERRDADGDKLHGDRAQHIFFAIGSCRSKEQIAAFIDYYVTCKEYDPSNLVYLFAATLEWDDTRSYGLDLFVNMNKVAFKKMPPGDKYHMRILKNFKRYVIGDLDLQKIQNHMTSDRNYTSKDLGKIDIPKMVKRIQNNVAYQTTIVEDLDEALKKLNF